MRDAAKIEYLGKFAEKPASGASAAAAASAANNSVASAPSVAASPAQAASTSMDTDALNKGLSGLK